MRSTIDKTGRVVIPAAIREKAGLTPGTTLEVTVDDTAVRIERDAHIAEVARAAGASVIVTDNRRHFLAALRHGIRVETPAEFLSATKRRG